MVLQNILGLLGFGKANNQQLIDQLHAQIVVAARQPAFYLEYGVRDVFDGRFELFTLLCTLVLRRLRQLPEPGSDVAQDLTDSVIRHLDIILRQEGIGDVAVPKRLKKYAKAFAGRSVAYVSALDKGDFGALQESLSRSFGSAEGANHFAAARMLGYVRATEDAFRDQELAMFTDGKVPFPDAEKTGESHV